MGSGLIWSELLRKWPVASYLGLDVKPKKGRLKIDSARYLEAGGWSHDVIDVDTYGSPWRHWLHILKNFQGTEATVFLTIGLIKMGGGGSMQTEVKNILGIPSKTPPGVIGSLHEKAVSYCLTACYEYGIVITEAVEAESTGNARYIGVRIRRGQ